MVNVPANLLDAAKSAAPDLWPVLVAIAMNESSDGRDGDYTVDGVNFFTRANAPPGAHPTSFGPLQLHTPGGLGDGYSPDQLRDWSTNFTIGANYIRNRESQGASLYQALSPWSTRDADYALYQRIEAEGVNGVAAATVGNTGGSSPSPSPIAPVGGKAGGLALIGLIALLLVLD